MLQHPKCLKDAEVFIHDCAFWFPVQKLGGSFRPGLRIYPIGIVISVGRHRPRCSPIRFAWIGVLICVCRRETIMVVCRSRDHGCLYRSVLCALCLFVFLRIIVLPFASIFMLLFFWKCCLVNQAIGNDFKGRLCPLHNQSINHLPWDWSVLQQISALHLFIYISFGCLM